MPPYPTGLPAYLEGPFVAPPSPVIGIAGQLLGKRCSLSGLLLDATEEMAIVMGEKELGVRVLEEGVGLGVEPLALPEQEGCTQLGSFRYRLKGSYMTASSSRRTETGVTVTDMVGLL